MMSMRRYALERPGMSAATFRNPEIDSPEWRAAQMQLARVVFAIFAQLGIKGEQAQHALRIMRSFVRGFVLHEMGASFLEPLEHDQSYEIGIEAFYRRAERVAGIEAADHVQWFRVAATSRTTDARDNARARSISSSLRG